MSVLVDRYKAVRARMGIVDAPRPVGRPSQVALLRAKTDRESALERDEKELQRLLSFRRTQDGVAPMSMKLILLTSCQCLGFPTDYVLAKTRRIKVARSRQIAMYLCRKLTHNSLPAIGDFFDCDHTTVLHAVRKIDELLEGGDAAIVESVGKIRAELARVTGRED